MTGNLHMRTCSKDLKKIFDQGLCEIWKQLKQESEKDLSSLSIKMLKVEQDLQGQITAANAFRAFSKLRSPMKKEGLDDCNFVMSSATMSLRLDDFRPMFGYEKDRIPAEIQKIASEIVTLKEQFESLPNPPEIPKKYEDPVSAEIMSLPLYSKSHDLKNAASASTVHLIRHKLRHNLDQYVFEMHLEDRTRLKLEFSCLECRQPILKEDVRINFILQYEILSWLREVINQHLFSDPISHDIMTIPIYHKYDERAYFD